MNSESHTSQLIVAPCDVNSLYNFVSSFWYFVFGNKLVVCHYLKAIRHAKNKGLYVFIMLDVHPSRKCFQVKVV